jgi:hypothetical protein
MTKKIQLQLYFFAFFFLFCSQISAEDQPVQAKSNYVLIDELRWDQGMFSALFTVVDYLNNYEKGQFSGLKVDLGTDGLYYEPKYGLNWWGYYFEPLEVGIKEGHPIEHTSKETAHHLAYSADVNLPRQRIAELTKKYIHPKLEILKTVDEFVANNFKKKFVIGIHYRGTDKYREAPLIPYEKVAEIVKNYGTDNHIEDYLIFVATDEQNFLNHMQKAFPGKVICLQCFRSSDGSPIHLVKPSPYSQGKEALIDCLLLSKCNVLLRTSSNLGAWSAFFNPELPVIILSARNI